MSFSLRNTGILIREASLADMPKLHVVLAEVQLSSDDILTDDARYWLAEDGYGLPVGVVGLELGQDAVLLRSAAVRPSHQGQGIGTYLVQYALNAAATSGYRRVYLFSTDVGAYWQRQGFREIPVSELVEALPETPQVVQYEVLGWLPTEIAWRLDLDEQGQISIEQQ